MMTLFRFLTIIALSQMLAVPPSAARMSPSSAFRENTLIQSTYAYVATILRRGKKSRPLLSRVPFTRTMYTPHCAITIGYTRLGYGKYLGITYDNPSAKTHLMVYHRLTDVWHQPTIISIRNHSATHYSYEWRARVYNKLLAVCVAELEYHQHATH